MEEVSPTNSDALAILASLAGLIVENAFYRKLLNKTAQK
jgi:hypothetical protein